MLDLRRVRVGIEVSGQINYYEGLRVKASGTKYANPLQNDCDVTISGLNQRTRDYILTETSPQNSNRSPKRIILEVGRVNSGLFRMYVGDITSAEPSSPPDLDIVIKSKTQNAQSGNIISTSAQDQIPLSSLAKKVASDIGLAVNFQAKDKKIGNYTHTGSALDQVKRLQESGGVNAFIDDDILIVKDYNKAIDGALKILNKDSGMVGIPKIVEKGISVTFLIDGQAKLGGMLRIDSKINKAVNGDYIINQLAFDVATHEDPFFYTALAIPA